MLAFSPESPENVFLQNLAKSPPIKSDYERIRQIENARFHEVGDTLYKIRKYFVQRNTPVINFRSLHDISQDLPPFE